MSDNLDKIFKKLENTFDIEEANIGHFNRFEAKLNAPKKQQSFKLYKLVGGFLIPFYKSIILDLLR